MCAQHLRGPGFFEVVLGSLLSILLGAVVAATILLLKPVEILREAPKDMELVPGKLYYFQGRKEYTAGQRWHFKRDSLLQGHTVRMNEDELNTWIETVYPLLPIEQQQLQPRPKKKAKGNEAAPKKKDEAPQPFIQTGTPNFRLMGNTLKLGVVYYIDVLGYSFTVVAQAEGSFVKPRNAETYTFQPETLMVGGLPAHKLLMLKGLIFDQLAGTFEFPEDLTKIWAGLADAKIENRELVLELPAGAAAP